MRRLGGIILSIGIALISCGQAETFDEKARSVLDGTVPLIMPEDCTDRCVFLDARELEEFQVSYIPHAHYVGYDDFDIDRVGASKSDTIVVYCSIGYRSEKIGERLQEAGFENVYNLYGGIFKWVNDGNKVHWDGKPTNRVHTYNEDWGQWLTRGTKVY